jgi:hypothetical protein
MKFKPEKASPLWRSLKLSRTYLRDLLPKMFGNHSLVTAALEQK